MSDLQCPARLFLAGTRWDGTGTSESGRLRELAQELQYERIVAVYTGADTQGRFVAALVADELGLTPSVITGVDQASQDESPTAVAARFRDAVGNLADLHRGETVLVICHRTALDALQHQLAVPEAESPDVAGVLEVEVTSDGWRVTPR